MSNYSESGDSATIPLEEYQIMHECAVRNAMLRDFIENKRVIHLEDALRILGYDKDADKFKEGVNSYEN